MKAAKDNINKIFATFDKDKSGFIVKDELKMVCQELGVQMNDMDVENMVKDLDLNKDGKISPDEFSLWWLSGRKGSTGKMSQLVAAKMGGKEFFDAMSASMKDLAAATQAGAYKGKKSEVSINVNGAQVRSEGGMQIHAKTMAFGTRTS